MSRGIINTSCLVTTPRPIHDTRYTHARHCVNLSTRLIDVQQRILTDHEIQDRSKIARGSFEHHTGIARSNLVWNTLPCRAIFRWKLVQRRRSRILTGHSFIRLSQACNSISNFMWNNYDSYNTGRYRFAIQSRKNKWKYLIFQV